MRMLAGADCGASLAWCAAARGGGSGDKTSRASVRRGFAAPALDTGLFAADRPGACLGTESLGTASLGVRLAEWRSSRAAGCGGRGGSGTDARPRGEADGGAPSPTCSAGEDIG
ncbi:MAG: hypothetical protein ABSG76_23050 [Xanthobacteraceae bacterium]|jgi:hypothetical protein